MITGDGKLVALDAKMTFDDNALFRHKDLRELRDLDEEDPLEVEASKYGLNYIKLDGTVACMVNGAGLAMATMDIIKYAGGSPANFLDVGGGASADQVKNAFGILQAQMHRSYLCHRRTQPTRSWKPRMRQCHWWCASRKEFPRWTWFAWQKS